MRFPLKTYKITSTYEDHIKAGGVRAKFAGEDFIPVGTPVIGTELEVIEDGTLTNFYETVNGKRGLASYIVSKDGLRRWSLAHMSKWLIKSGTVKEGQKFALTGASGFVSGAHTHLGLEEKDSKGNWVRVAPLPVIYSLPKNKKYELIRDEWLKPEPKCKSKNIGKIPTGRVCEITSNAVFDCGHYWQYAVFTDWQGWLPNDCLKATTKPITSGKPDEDCKKTIENLRAENSTLRKDIQTYNVKLDQKNTEIAGLTSQNKRLNEVMVEKEKMLTEVITERDELLKVNTSLRKKRKADLEDFTIKQVIDFLTSKRVNDLRLRILDWIDTVLPYLRKSS